MISRDSQQRKERNIIETQMRCVVAAIVIKQANILQAVQAQPTHIPFLSICSRVYVSFVYGFFSTCLFICYLCAAYFVFFDHISPPSIYLYARCVDPYVFLPFCLPALPAPLGL